MPSSVAKYEANPRATAAEESVISRHMFHPTSLQGEGVRWRGGAAAVTASEWSGSCQAGGRPSEARLGRQLSGRTDCHPPGCQFSECDGDVVEGAAAGRPGLAGEE